MIDIIMEVNNEDLIDIGEDLKEEYLRTYTDYDYEPIESFTIEQEL